MKKFTIARTQGEEENKIKEKYNAIDIVLDDSDFINTQFNIVKEKEINK